MDLTLTSEEQAFRDEVRAWLEENHPGPEPEGEEAKFEFRARLAAQAPRGRLGRASRGRRSTAGAARP